VTAVDSLIDSVQNGWNEFRFKFYSSFIAIF